MQRQSGPYKILIATAVLAAALLHASLSRAQEPQKIGENLYAFISTNDASANSTFLVTADGILVVDSGLNETEGKKLLEAIRTVSTQPVRFIVHTHYHPDHQGGTAVVGPNAVVISTEWTRKRTLDLLKSVPEREHSTFRPASLIFFDSLKIYLGGYTAEVNFPGPAHTSGDALVYFPQQRVVAMGDLFLNGSCPAMDAGSAANWVKALDQVLSKSAESFVPGHFALGSRAELLFFRSYLADLFAQVQALVARGATLEMVKHGLQMEKYKSLREFPQYHATFADNAETMFKELSKH